MAEIWGVALGAAATVVGGAMSADSARSAGNKEKDASAAALAEQRRIADRTYADEAPYRAAGTKALDQLATENGTMPTAEEVMSDPGYKFGLDQGQLGLDRKQAAQGGRVSGAALKAASEYATNYATTGYGAAYQRRQDRLNRLAALAGIGQTATGASAAAGAGSANAISGLLTDAGSNAGAAGLAQGNIWGNVGNQLAATASRWAKAPSTSPYTPGVGDNGAGGSPDGYW